MCGLAWCYGEAIGVLAQSGSDVFVSSAYNFNINTLDHISLSVLLLVCTHAVPVFVQVFPARLVVERRIRRSERRGTVEAHLLRRTDVCPGFCGGQQRVCFSWNCCVRVSDGLLDICGYSEFCPFALRGSGPRVWYHRRIHHHCWFQTLSCRQSQLDGWSEDQC